MKDCFYQTREWRELRFKVLTNNKRQCACCLATNRPLHVDHIKPISKYPHLKLEYSNLQILCEDCNLGKSNIYNTDFRKNIKRAELKQFRLEKKKKKKELASLALTNGINSTHDTSSCSFLTATIQVSHIWNGKSTLCDLWETTKDNGKKVARYVFTKEPMYRICKNCIKEQK